MKEKHLIYICLTFMLCFTILIVGAVKIYSHSEQDLQMIESLQQRMKEQDKYITEQAKLIRFERLLWTMLGNEGKDNLLAMEGCLKLCGTPTETIRIPNSKGGG